LTNALYLRTSFTLDELSKSVVQFWHVDNIHPVAFIIQRSPGHDKLRPRRAETLSSQSTLSLRPLVHRTVVVLTDRLQHPHLARHHFRSLLPYQDRFTVLLVLPVPHLVHVRVDLGEAQRRVGSWRTVHVSRRTTRRNVIRIFVIVVLCPPVRITREALGGVVRMRGYVRVSHPRARIERVVGLGDVDGFGVVTLLFDVVARSVFVRRGRVVVRGEVFLGLVHESRRVVETPFLNQVLDSLPAINNMRVMQPTIRLKCLVTYPG
jgi:hypothetical protein